MHRHPWIGRFLLALTCLALTQSVAPAQLNEQQQVDLLLGAARKAYTERNYPFAGTKFREFVQRFGGRKEADEARYGLALCLVEGVEKNWTEARDLFNQLANSKNFTSRPEATYFQGYSLRGLGLNELALAQAKPPEAAARQAEAQKRFTEAAVQFKAAVALFTERAGKNATAEKLPEDLEWAARATCDLAEMNLRTLKVKEARAVSMPFVKKDDVLTRSKYRDLGRYYHGFACFLQGDHKAAEVTLAQLTPFNDPLFGTHARYLLARVHHSAGERGEAGLHYEGVLKDYAAHRLAATAALKKPEVQRNPVEKARHESFLKETPPDHVARAAFYQGVLLYEAGRFGEAKERFAAVLKQFPQTPVLQETELRLGFCQVQLREYAEAQKLLQALMTREPRLADQAQYWLARAQLGAAPDPATNFNGHKQAAQAALTQMLQAADKARNLLTSDPEAKERRGEMLLEAGDVQHRLQQYKEAIARYQTIIQEKLLPQRQEELVQRILTAQHLDGAFDASDRTCQEFFAGFPKSSLTPAVRFRFAENAYFRALEYGKNPSQANFQQELNRRLDEVIQRYEDLVKKYPEFAQINLARHGLGLAWYRKGDLEKARQTLEAIPQSDRGGELAVVNYLMADCLLRQLPETTPEDALEAGKLEERLKTAAGLLDSFISSDGKSPESGDALLKMGLCQQKLAALLAQPPERKAALDSARATYDKLLQPQWAKHPAQPQAFLERAKVYALSGNVGQAQTELQRFQQEPLKSSTVAPLALLHLATLHRAQNRIDEAVKILASARTQYEGALKADPSRSGWVHLLRYHEGVGLRETKKYPEARQLFELVFKEGGTRPEAGDAALRFGQCLREEGTLKYDAGRKLQAAARKPEEMATARQQLEEGLSRLREGVKFLEGQIQTFQQKKQFPDVQARMLYEAAWCQRELAREEIEQARRKIQSEKIKKLGEKGKLFPPPLVTLQEVPSQPAEQKARAAYKALISGFGDGALAIEARFELAELLGDRGEHEEAIKLLREGLDGEPPQELTEKIRIRLGASYAARGDLKNAMNQFDAVAKSANIPLAAQSHYRAGEVYLARKEYPEAIKRLALFRDDGKFQNIPGVSDRALLRLGHACAHVEDWNASRQAHETLVGRFPQSPWVNEARYGLGRALQQLKQYDQAVAVHGQITSSSAAETAAKAQLQIGLARLEQKRYPEASTALLVVPYTYDYPELNAVALLEAARAFAEQKQSRQAIPLLQRVVREHPNTRWAEAARDRLEALQK